MLFFCLWSRQRSISRSKCSTSINGHEPLHQISSSDFYRHYQQQLGSFRRVSSLNAERVIISHADKVRVPQDKDHTIHFCIACHMCCQRGLNFKQKINKKKITKITKINILFKYLKNKLSNKGLLCIYHYFKLIHLCH